MIHFNKDKKADKKAYIQKGLQIKGPKTDKRAEIFSFKLTHDICSHTSSALNAGAKRSGATCHLGMPQCCYLAKGTKRPSHTTNMLTSPNDSSSIHIGPFVCFFDLSVWPFCLCFLALLSVFFGPFVCVFWPFCQCFLALLSVFFDPFVCVFWPFCLCFLALLSVFFGLFVWNPFCLWPFCMCTQYS